MNISFVKNGNVSGIITLDIEKADYEGNVKKALKEYGKKAQMPGFRPGKVPASLINKMYGQQIKVEEVNKLLSDKLFSYIQENKIDMLGEPLPNEKQEPQDIEKQDNFKFMFDIAIAPEINVAPGKDDKIVYYDINISDDDIKEEVKGLQQRAGHPEDAEVYTDGDILRGSIVELDENGNAKEGGIQLDQVSLMPRFFNNEDQKKLFKGAKKGADIVFNPSKAYEGRDVETATLLKIEKDKVAEHTGDFKFHANEISHFVPAEMNQEFFDQIMGKDAVKSEEEFLEKVKEGVAERHQLDEDFRFLMDVRKYFQDKLGKLEFPEDLLKRIMKANNKDKGDKFIDDNYPKSIEELTWNLIKNKLAEVCEVKVEDKDVKEAAVETARIQFAQYGLTNVPDEYIENYATEMLKHKEQLDSLVQRSIDKKLVSALKEKVTLDHKAISPADFRNLFTQDNA